MLRSWRALGLGAVFLTLAASPAWAQESAPERHQARELLRQSVAFDTSAAGGQNPAMAAMLAERFRAAGFAEEDVRILPLGDTAGLLVRYRGDGGGGRPILLLAHMDVVPARREEWSRDPFTLVEEDGFFFGRGALDNKAGVAQLAATFMTLRVQGFMPTRDLILWLSGDEETTGATTTTLLTEHRELIGNPEFALNSDAGGGQLGEDGAAIAYAVQTAEKT